MSSDLRLIGSAAVNLAQALADSRNGEVPRSTVEAAMGWLRAYAEDHPEFRYEIRYKERGE